MSIKETLNISKLIFAKSEVMADFMQQGIANLLCNLRFIRADGFNGLLVQKNVVWRVGGENALHGPWNSRKEAQQQAAPIGFAWWRVFNNNCKVRQPAPKRFRQAVQCLFDQPLESLTLH